MEGYTGPIFDVQTHAILPETYGAMCRGVMSSSNLTDGTMEIMKNDIIRKLADNLQGVARKEILDRNTVHATSIVPVFPPVPIDKVIELCDHLNVWIASATADNKQLVGIASIPPPPLLEKAGLRNKGLKILRRAIVELKLKGAIFASNYDGSFLGDVAFDPYFELLEELNVPIIVHPAVHPVEEKSTQRKNMGALSGFLNDQRTTLLDIVLAGVLEKYPGLIIIATHLGGGILSSLGRFRNVSARFPQESWYIDRDGTRRLLPQTIETYLKKIYYDCNNADLDDILHAQAKLDGAEHLLTGTDFPWADDKFTRQVLGELKEQDMRVKIAYNNAATLFRKKPITLDDLATLVPL